MVSAYLPSASVSDGSEDQHCLPCLADPSGNLTVTNTFCGYIWEAALKNHVQNQESYLRVRTQDHPHDHKTPIPQILRLCQNFPYRMRRTERIIERRLNPRRGRQASVVPNDSLGSCLAPTGPPTNNHIIKIIHPSPVSTA